MKWANQRLWYYLKSFFGVGRNKAGRSGHEAGYHVLIIVVLLQMLLCLHGWAIMRRNR